MTAVDPELRREMLERELHGIEVELEQKKASSTLILAQIVDLERDKLDIVNLLKD